MSDASTGLRFNPSPAQRLLIETPGSQVVRVCPGAGKTQSIVERFILRPGLDPRRGVALISFTNAAITAAQERCRDHPERLKAPNFVFGREDDLDQQAVRRLVASGRGRPRDAAATERVLFALVANRALAPASKLAAAEWMSHDVHIDGFGEVSDDACYRAMDWLHQVRGELEKQVYFQVADLLNLQVDLLFFDTTSTYFETEDPDGDVPRDWRGEPATDEHGPAPLRRPPTGSSSASIPTPRRATRRPAPS
ncbi:hypothetical protein FMEAI12_5000021 [Parafrankia sp. Ea1.12]|uniref:hypothetical protein n=1 Tax=Parafrankia sp. Ea1.12 TaxID=573499 RepID=UPI000DA54ED5|nr:hypothetical protein [Parafrankia sp. Ea1.12]SQD98929.1 hypothetical protein FMEAI12_5000021 [Parafrankia sp. Ea1.12]